MFTATSTPTMTIVLLFALCPTLLRRMIRLASYGWMGPSRHRGGATPRDAGAPRGELTEQRFVLVGDRFPAINGGGALGRALAVAGDERGIGEHLAQHAREVVGASRAVVGNGGVAPRLDVGGHV